MNLKEKMKINIEFNYNVYKCILKIEIRINFYCKV